MRWILAQLPREMPGLVIVQHMPARFIERFALRLNELSALNVAIATEGAVVTPGLALIAPGEVHLKLRGHRGRLVCELDPRDSEDLHRPSVDALFCSIADAAGPRAAGVLLTGMGRDGAAGLKRMRDAGAFTIAQDEASSVVFGMPRAAIAAGGAVRVLPLAEIPGALVNLPVE